MIGVTEAQFSVIALFIATLVFGTELLRCPLYIVCND